MNKLLLNNKFPKNTLKIILQQKNEQVSKTIRLQDDEQVRYNDYCNELTLEFVMIADFNRNTGDLQSDDRRARDLMRD